MIIIISGDIGSGKTMYLTSLIINKLKYGYTVYTNYNIKIPENYKKQLIFIEKEMVGNLDYWRTINHKKICIAIDEIHNVCLDSRRGMVGRNVRMTHWMAQIRKCLRGNKKNHFYCTTQYLHQVDKRLRSLARRMCYCQSGDEPCDPIIVEHYRKNPRVEGDWLYLFRTWIGPEQKDRLFRLYDTYEMVDEWD